MSTASSMLNVARREIGVREDRSRTGSWNNRVKYNDWYVDTLKKGSVYRSASWCAIFVSWVARHAGVPTSVIPNHAYTPTGWNWFKSRGLAVSDPRPGDILYVFYPRMGRIGHVGIVERRDGNYVITIEGNTNTNGSSQGNGVYRLRRRITSNLRFARPRYAGTATKPPKAGGKSVAQMASEVVAGKHGNGHDSRRRSLGVDAATYAKVRAEVNRRATGKPAATSTPTVSLSKLIEAARKDGARKQGGTTPGAAASVKLVEQALMKEGLLNRKWASDGSFGTITVAAYSSWQRRLGYRGRDADGIPGRASLEKLGAKYGFRVAS